MKVVLAFFVSLFVLVYVYLLPGSEALVSGRADIVMSDGTDPTALPYIYDRVLYVWNNHPLNMFFGSVYDPVGDGIRGAPYWIAWNERWLVVLYSYIFPLEQISTAFVFTIMMLNGLIMFVLGRYLGWSNLLSAALAIAWAINCYTRARAKVHAGFSGIYHLPLIFLGLLLIVRGKSWRSVAGAAVAFWGAATVAHYYLVTCVFLSPFFVLFVLVQPEFKKNRKKILFRMVTATLPVILFLGFNRIMTVPPDAKVTSSQSMPSEGLQMSGVSPFLHVYRAYPIDYISGDVSLEGESDINPLRGFVDEYVKKNLHESNTHERTNGIRWTILALAFTSLIFLIRGDFRKNLSTTRNQLFFWLFAMFTFWMSMGPEAPIPALSPSYWLYSLDQHIRVTNRSGIQVHFSLLMIVGFFLAQVQLYRHKKWVPWAFVALVLVDYLPLKKPQMASIQPAYAQLQREKGPCGIGMAFPYISQWSVPMEHYLALQRMRESDCAILNSNTDRRIFSALTEMFPPRLDYLENLGQNVAAAIKLEKFASCVPLNWIAFHSATPRKWAEGVCGRLGWEFSENMTCVAPQKDRSLSGPIENCL